MQFQRKVQQRHASRTGKLLIVSFFLLMDHGFMVECRWRCWQLTDVTEVCVVFMLGRTVLARLILDVIRYHKMSMTSWSRMSRYEVISGPMRSHMSIDIARGRSRADQWFFAEEAEAGGGQQRTRTWQKREAGGAIHNQPVPSPFLPMGWARLVLCADHTECVDASFIRYWYDKASYTYLHLFFSKCMKWVLTRVSKCRQTLQVMVLTAQSFFAKFPSHNVPFA